MRAFAAVIALMTCFTAEAATMVMNVSGSNYTLPANYGSLTLTAKAGVNHAVIIADTRANVAAVLGLPKGQRILALSTVPDGQPGAITPYTPPMVLSGKVSTAGVTSQCVTSPSGLADGAYFVKAEVSAYGVTDGGAQSAMGFEFDGLFTVDAGLNTQVSTTTSLMSNKGAFNAASAAAFYTDGGASLQVSVTSALTETADWACRLQIGPSGF